MRTFKIKTESMSLVKDPEEIKKLVWWRLANIIKLILLVVLIMLVINLAQTTLGKEGFIF